MESNGKNVEQKYAATAGCSSTYRNEERQASAFWLNEKHEKNTHLA